MSLPVAETGFAVNRTTSGAISAGACQLLGFYVNSTSSGVIQILDGGSGGTAVGGNITPAIGWHRYPANLTNPLGAYMVKASGSINVTFSFATGN